MENALTRAPLVVVSLLFLLTFASFYGCVGGVVHGFFLLFRGRLVVKDYWGPALALTLIVANTISICYLKGPQNEWVANRRVADGMVTSSLVVRTPGDLEIAHEGGDSYTRTHFLYQIRLQYAFTGPSAEVTSERPLTGWATLETDYGSQENAESHLKTESFEGKHFPVYYDARNPNRNMLTELPNNPNSSAITGFIIYSTLLGVYIAGFFAFWLKHRPPPAAQPTAPAASATPPSAPQTDPH